MQFRILGPLEVLDAGRPLRLGRAAGHQGPAGRAPGQRRRALGRAERRARRRHRAFQATVAGLDADGLAAGLPAIVGGLERIDQAWTALQQQLDRACPKP